MYEPDSGLLADARKALWRAFRDDAARGREAASLPSAEWRAWAASLDLDNDHDLAAWAAALAARGETPPEVVR